MKNILFTFLFFIPLFCFAQEKQKNDSAWHVMSRSSDERQFGLNASLNAGKYITGTLGLTYAYSDQTPEVWFLSAVGLQAELIDPKRNAYGFGAEAWANGYVSLGLAAMDYTDFINSRV